MANKNVAVGKKPRKLSPAPLADGDGKFPGPSPDPQTNLIMTDILLRGVSAFARRGIERRLLSGYGRKKAKEIVGGRTVGQTVASALAARLAMRSVPGALVVGVVMIGKTLLDRSRKRSPSPRDRTKLLRNDID